MGVYIDREQAIKCLDGSVLITRQSEAEAVREYFEMVIKRLENLPTIDLVRCGECKFWDGIECHNDRASTDLEGGAEYALYRDDTDFCSYGERRADEHTSSTILEAEE